MATFQTTWLPNLVCLAAGFLLGWLMTHLYARQQSKELRSLREDLLGAEGRGEITLKRDASGHITGATVLRIDTGALGLTGHTPQVTVGGSDPSARNTLTITTTDRS